MRNKGKKDRGRLKKWLIWIGETPNACGTNLRANSFSKINSVFEPLLAPRGWRVHWVGAQVGINRCWRASGWSLAQPDGLRTLLLGDGVLKHTLINWEWETEEEKRRWTHSQVLVGIDICCKAADPSSIHGILTVTTGCANSLVGGKWKEYSTKKWVEFWFLPTWILM